MFKSFTSFFTTPIGLDGYINDPYTENETYLADFSIHGNIIKNISEKDILSIPEPTTEELLEVFPMNQAIYNHIVESLSAVPNLNALLLKMVKRQMKECEFWYKYFRYLFTQENVSILTDIKKKRSGYHINAVTEYTIELMRTFIQSNTIGNKNIILMKYIQLINQTENNALNTSYFNFTEILEKKDKTKNEVEFEKNFFITVFDRIFKNCKFYLPYLSILLQKLIESNQYDSNTIFYNVLQFIITSLINGQYFFSKYTYDDYVDYFYLFLCNDCEELRTKPKDKVISFIQMCIKNLTIPFYNDFDAMTVKPILEFILEEGKTGVLKILTLIFRKIEMIDFDNMNDSITKIIKSYDDERMEQNNFFVNVCNLKMKSEFYQFNHFYNTLYIPEGDDTAQQVVSIDEIKGLSEIINENEMIELIKMLPQRLQMLVPTMIFKSSVDGLNLNTLYQKVEHSSLLLIICKKCQFTFGVFVAEYLEVRKDYHGNGETFLFTIKPEIKKYGWVEGSNNFIISSTKENLSFGGGNGRSSLIFDEYLNCESYNTPTFNNPPLFQTIITRCEKVEVLTFC